MLLGFPVGLARERAVNIPRSSCGTVRSGGQSNRRTLVKCDRVQLVCMYIKQPVLRAHGSNSDTRSSETERGSICTVPRAMFGYSLSSNNVTIVGEVVGDGSRCTGNSLGGCLSGGGCSVRACVSKGGICITVVAHSVAPDGILRAVS